MCRVFCEEMEIPFYRFSPEVGESIGTAEKDNMKLCDSIIAYVTMAYLPCCYRGFRVLLCVNSGHYIIITITSVIYL